MPDETAEQPEATGIEKMVADAVDNIKGFCDSIRSDFDALKGRMDSFEAKPADEPKADDALPEGDELVIEHPPVAVTEEPAAAEDAAIEGAAPAELAADAGEWMEPGESMADSVAREQVTGLRRDLDRLSRLVPAELTIEQRQAFAVAQEQAEQAFTAFGDHAPAPMSGEGIGTYKRRLASKMQSHSDKWKGTKLTAISDDATLDVIVGDIYNDAVAVARRGADVPNGQLVPVTRRTEAGHTIREYRGSPGAWMRPLAGATRRATGKFNLGR
jgi:hypothetical protein